MSDSTSVSPNWPSDKFLFGVKLNSPSDISTLSPEFSIVKISGNYDPDAISQIRQRNSNILIIADLFDSLIREGYVDVSMPDLRERLRTQIRYFYRQHIRHFELWHTPNRLAFGMGQAQGWHNGASFGTWYADLVSVLKSEFPEIFIGYPALAITIAPVAWDKFLAESHKAVEITDWIRVDWALRDRSIPTPIGEIINSYRGFFIPLIRPVLVEVTVGSSEANNTTMKEEFQQLHWLLSKEFHFGGLIADVDSLLLPGLKEIAARLNSDQAPPQTPKTPRKKTRTRKKAQEQTEQEQASDGSITEVAEPEPKTEDLITELVTHHSVANDQLPVVDQLHYDDYARALAEVLVSEETTTPLTVGIYGAWGMGKSFLMRRVKQMVTDWPKDVLGIRPGAQKPKHEFHFVEFNAWVYSGSENLWAGLVTALYDSIETYLGRWKALRFRLNRNLRKSVGSKLVISALWIVLAAIVGLILDFDVWLKQWDTLRIALAGVSALAAVPPLISAFREFYSNIVVKRSDQFTAIASRRDFKDKIGFMADIKSEITEIRELLEDRRKKDKPLRVVILIDDLDRCPPAKAVEVLEAIMLLLADKDGAPFIVLLGIDARIIVKAIEERYAKVLVEAGVTGYEYLDKIVQIPFRIPEPDEDNRKSYVASLLASEAITPLQSITNVSLAHQTTQPAETRVQSSDSNIVPTQPASETPPVERQSGSTDTPTPVPAVQPKTIEVSTTKGEKLAFEGYAKYLSPNPRRIKRIVNVYRVARLLPRSLTESQRRKLIKWVILSEQWPLRLSWILEEIENDEQQFPDGNMPDSNKGAEDKPAAERRYNANCTLGEVFEKIREQFQNTARTTTLDGDPELFEQFVKQEPLLTVEDNKWLRPLSFNLNPAIRQEIWKARLGSKQVDK